MHTAESIRISGNPLETTGVLSESNVGFCNGAGEKVRNIREKVGIRSSGKSQPSPSRF